MLTIKIHIDDETRKIIKDTYGKDDYETVNSVVDNIVERYLDVEHFDPELSTGENADYKTCESCGEKSKSTKMIDVDGKNLEEHDVCENCGSGYPVLK